jgi:hypothetical protein
MDSKTARMSQAKDTARALALAALVAGTAACLPRGEPPSGHQAIVGRDSQLAAIAPPNGDGVLRILVFRPGAAADSKDLYVVSVDADGAPISDTLLVADLDLTADLGCLERLPPCSIDPAGWTWVYTKTGGYGAALGVNTITGERMQRDPGEGYVLSSPSGQRQFGAAVAPYMAPSTPGTFKEPDGTVLMFDVVPPGGLVGQSFGFFGEDFYYLTPQGAMMHIPPSGAAEQVAVDVVGFLGYVTPDGVLLVIVRKTSDPDIFAPSVRDPVTGQETVLPFSDVSHAYLGDIQLSSDARWLLLNDSAARRFVFLDPRSGAQQVIAFPDGFDGLYGYTLRPGTRQIWLTTWVNNTPTVRILSPDAPPVAVPGVWLAMGFTDDAVYWLSSATSQNETLDVLQIGRADDPTGPRRFLTPPGTYLNTSWSLPDGRWLMAVFTKDADRDRSDMIVTDLATGESRLLAERGRMVTLGETRFLGQFHFSSGVGDLTSVDIASGRQTMLAREFSVTAFPEPQGTDPFAPGTRVVYEFAARSPSPYDGIWVVTVP